MRLKPCSLSSGSIWFPYCFLPDVEVSWMRILFKSSDVSLLWTFLTFLFGFLKQKMYFIVLRKFTGISKHQQCPVFTLILISGMGDWLWKSEVLTCRSYHCEQMNKMKVCSLSPASLHLTAPSCFITSTDCVKLLPDIFPIDTLTKMAKITVILFC